MYSKTEKQVLRQIARIMAVTRKHPEPIALMFNQGFCFGLEIAYEAFAGRTIPDSLRLFVLDCRIDARQKLASMESK